MIIRIEAAGGSFRGAGLYYLHDKAADKTLDKHLKPDSDERVWFTDTRNCLNTDPERALDEMWRTAEDQAYLKMQAGVKRGGRPCEDPVKTLSMSWHKDDAPTPEHMVECADAFLKHMGWDSHQAVYVGHNDTGHRHVHIILNRINPENGRTLDDYRDHKRAQVWALAYEKEHETIRCEERELRAAKREHRAPEFEPGKAPDNASEQQPGAQQTPPKPANDHLPHNVIMLSREHERAFHAREQARESADRDRRAELKAEQRAEREAFFKDGAKEFKALRHAVYDTVRKEYAPEWRQLYKDSAVAERSAEAWSASSVTRALYFAKHGKWEEAGKAYADRDSVRDAVTDELAERKAALKARQTDDLRDRQREACNSLRENRDIEYQELLVRQRYERGALGAAAMLDTFGNARSADAVTKSTPEHSANENQLGASPPAATPEPTPEQQNVPAVAPTPIEQGQAALMQDMLAAIDKALPAENGAALRPPELPTDAAPAVTHQLTDLAAGAIGSAANYLADQLGELFAPTPPEVREAQAKAEANRDAEKPPAPEKTDPYAKIINATVLRIEEERTSAKDDAYWKERDRGKGWERDQ